MDSLHEPGQGDVALALDGAASLDVASRAVERLFARARAGGSSTFTVSLVRIRGAAGAPEDLLGHKQGVISGVPVSCAADAHSHWRLSRFLARTGTGSGSDGLAHADVVATVTVRPQLQRLHLVRFFSPGLWSSRGGLPERLRDKCRCVLVTSDGDGPTTLSKEWRNLFELPAQEVAAVDASGGLAADLRAARARIAQLEEQLEHAQDQLALRENTLINVLLGSHPAFEGLSDAQAKQSAKKQRPMSARATEAAIPLPAPLGNKENAADVNRMVGFYEQSAPLKVRCCVRLELRVPKKTDWFGPIVQSIGSTGGALRVVKTPGARQKTKSRVF